MAQINVAQFAKELGVPSALLLEQLQAAGVTKKLLDETPLTEQDKTQLLEYLRQCTAPKRARTRSRSHAGRRARSRRPTAPARRAPSRWRCARSACSSSASRLSRGARKRRLSRRPSRSDAEQTAMREEEARKQAELIARQAAEAAVEGRASKETQGAAEEAPKPHPPLRQLKRKQPESSEAPAAPVAEPQAAEAVSKTAAQACVYRWHLAQACQQGSRDGATRNPPRKPVKELGVMKAPSGAASRPAARIPEGPAGMHARTAIRVIAPIGRWRGTCVFAAHGADRP